MQDHHDFCTLFDTGYLPRALVLYRSLERCCESFTLRAYCLDEQSEQLLRALELPHVQTVPIAGLEERDPELRAVRHTRSLVEYYWTCTPAICLDVFAREPELESLTYLDADLCFYSDPGPLRSELGDGSMLLVPQHLPPTEGETGMFNVGWVGFRNGPDARAALGWWRERCLEWCHDRLEPDRFGDQKYLDAWPERFAGVRISSNPAAGLGTWNVGERPLERAADGSVLVEGAPLLFHHFAGLYVHPATGFAGRMGRRHPGYRSTAGPVPLVWTVFGRPPQTAIDLFWRPYVERLSAAVSELVAVGAPEAIGTTTLRSRTAIGQFVRAFTASRFLRVYRRLPLRHRHRIARRLMAS